jgi:hypothetical protein
MIRHPSENFIKFLITSMNPQMQDNGAVNVMVTMLGYPPARDDYLTWLRGDVAQRMPAQFTPANRYHRPSVRFMRQEGIYGLHNPDEEAREAASITTHLRARPMVEELLLGHLEPVTVAKKVNARLGEHFTVGGIEAYRHYYWNVRLLRVEEWAMLLTGYEEQKSKTLAILQVGPQMALHQAGFQQELESKAILREMQETLYFDFMQWKKAPHSVKRTQMLAGIAKSVTVIDERLMESNSLLKDSLKQFENFRMQHARSNVADLRDLAPDGNFSGSGAKLLEAPKKEEGEKEEKSE